MKLLRNPDANLGGESSSFPAAQAIVVPQQSAKDGAVEGVKIDTSVKKDVGFDPQSIAEQIKAKYNIGKTSDEVTPPAKADGESLTPSKTDEEKAAESPILNSNETPEQKLARESKEKTEALATPDDKLPFHKHPRFQQVISERNEFEQKLAEYKPAAERMYNVEKFCRENNVPAVDYDESIRLAAMVHNDPKAALERLEKVVEALRVQTGSALPRDLQTQVNDGKLTEETAQEIVQLRLRANGAQNQVKMTQESVAQRAQQELVSSLDAWTKSRSLTDPSFKPKAQGQRDGKYELITDKFLALWNRQPPQGVSQAVALLERAYSEVHEFIEQNIPKPTVRRPLTPKVSEAPKNEPVDIRKPGWAKEIARRTLAASVN